MRVRNHTNPFNFYKPLVLDDYRDLLNQINQAGIAVEIGCGRGVFLRQFATENPDKHIIGIETRKPLVTQLQARIAALNLTNAHVIYGEGVQVTSQLFGQAQVDTLFVFHPDPWLKKRHHNRRIIHNNTLEKLRPAFAINAKIHVMTDVHSLYQDMQAVIQATDWLSIATHDDFWQADYQSHWQQFSAQNNRACYTLTAHCV